MTADWSQDNKHPLSDQPYNEGDYPQHARPSNGHRNHIQGEYKTRRVWLDGRELKPARSLKVWNHSPTGFNWSYGGSGPAQLALAILLEMTDQATAISLHQQFKWEVISLISPGDFDIFYPIREWIETHQAPPPPDPDSQA